MGLSQNKYSTISEHRTQNTEHGLKTQNSELRTQNSELKTQNSKLGTRNSELEVQQLGTYKTPPEVSLFRTDLTFSFNDPLVRTKLLQCHGTTGMHFLRTDTDFGSQSKLCSIRKGC